MNDKQAKALGLTRERHGKMQPSEDAEQLKLAQWLDAHRLLWTHPANGASKTPAQRGKFKALGQKAGVPDILVFQRPTRCPWSIGNCSGGFAPHREPACSYGASGVAIELKRQRPASSVVSPEQKTWLQALSTNGWIARVCYGADEAIALLESLGFGGGR